MSNLDSKGPTRSLTIVLPESDWHALRNVEPDTVGWLQDRIRERLAAVSEPAREFETSVRSSSETYWGADEY
jgi:hypothetical protein